MVFRLRRPWRHVRRPTLVESLVIVAILAVLLALWLPPVQWVADGDIRLMVRVLVFDAVSGTPIPDARVAVFAAPPFGSDKTLGRDSDRYDPRRYAREGNTGTTDETGAAAVDFEFLTIASDRNPTPRALVNRAWVHVNAGGYGETVVPVRHQSQPIADVRDRPLIVPVGLIRVADDNH